MSAELNNVPEKLMRLFNRYPDVTAEELARVYANSVVFEDPVVRLTGLDKVSNYFRKMYRGVISCEFNYRDVVACEQQAAISWTMNLRHQALKHGKPVVVRGCSVIRFDSKVYYHRDYFDMAEMVYANVPLLGWAIRQLRNRLRSQ